MADHPNTLPCTRPHRREQPQQHARRWDAIDRPVAWRPERLVLVTTHRAAGHRGRAAIIWLSVEKTVDDGRTSQW